MNLLLGHDAALQNLSTFLSRRDLLNLSRLTKRWHLKILALPELKKKFLQTLERFVEEAAVREKQENPTSNILAKYLKRPRQEEKLTRTMMALFTQIRKKITPAWQIEIMAEFMRTMPAQMPSVFMLVFQDLCRFRPTVALEFLFFDVAPDAQAARVNAVYGHRTPLMVAAANGAAELLQRMLAIPNVDADKAVEMLGRAQPGRFPLTRNPRYTALAHAAESGNKTAVLTLLAHGATATRPCHLKVLSALDCALQSEDDGFVKTVYKHYLSQRRTAPGEPLLKYCRDTLAQHRLQQTAFIAGQAELAERHMQQLGHLFKKKEPEVKQHGDPLTARESFLLHRAAAVPLINTILDHSWMLTWPHVEQVIRAICWLDSPALAQRAAHRQVIHGMLDRLPHAGRRCIWIQAAQTGACDILDWLRGQVERKGRTEQLVPLLDYRRGLDGMRAIEHAMHARQFDAVALLRQWGGTLLASSPQALDTSLNTAKQAGQEGLYQALLEVNEHAQFRGMSPLTWSAMLSDTTLFERFLQRSGEPTERDFKSFFKLAMNNGNFNLFRKLRELAPDIADKYTTGLTRAAIRHHHRDQLKAILGVGENGAHGESWLSKDQFNQPNKRGKTLVELYLEQTRFNQLAAENDAILNALVAQGGIPASGDSVDRNGVEQQLAERGYFRKEVPLFTPPKRAPRKKIEVLSSEAQQQGLHLQPPPSSVIGQDFFSSSEILGKMGTPTSHT